MRVLVALTYFRPHVSGLTIYVERLVAALAERGHEVTVLPPSMTVVCPGKRHRVGCESSAYR